jgi:hypothetical protein
MTPATVAIADDVSNRDVLAPESLAATSEAGTEFEPAVLGDPCLGRGLFMPMHSLAFHLEPALHDPFESISSQALFASSGPALAPAGESGDPTPPAATWIEPVVERFDELVALPPDWDHHGANAIDPRDLLSVFRFLRDVMQPNTPPPAVVPISGGGVQLEWHLGGLDVEVSVVDQGAAELYLYDIGADREWEGPAVAGFAEHRLEERLSE